MRVYLSALSFALRFPLHPRSPCFLQRASFLRVWAVFADPLEHMGGSNLRTRFHRGHLVSRQHLSRLPPLHHPPAPQHRLMRSPQFQPPLPESLRAATTLNRSTISRISTPDYFAFVWFPTGLPLRWASLSPRPLVLIDKAIRSH